MIINSSQVELFPEKEWEEVNLYNPPLTELFRFIFLHIYPMKLSEK